MYNTFCMEISAISSIDSMTPITLSKVREVLTSNKISQGKKTEFVRHFKTQIQEALDVKLTGIEYKRIMGTRPLQKFRIFKNSITKRGDKRMLAMLLEIEPAEVDEYIKNVTEAMKDVNELGFLPKNKMDSIKTYVYRHGSKDEIVEFLDYELRTSKDVLKTLYSTLEYHTGGIADYFIRPVHRMTNNTMIRLYNVIDKNLKSAYETGSITREQYDKDARNALIRIYQIQNNSKLINAIKTYKILKQ